MPPRSTVDLLPEAVRDELDRRIVTSAFGGYAAHSAWLWEQGHPVSVAAVGRYGRRLRGTVRAERMRMQEATATAIAHVKASMETAKALREATGGDPLLIGEAAADLIVARLYDAAASGELDTKDLQDLARALERGVGASVSIRKERGDREKTLQGLADAAAKLARNKGASPETEAVIRSAIEGREVQPERPDRVAPETLKIIRRDVYGIYDEDPPQ